jgi:hypothetical protein
MWTSSLFNKIISELGYSSYLELGVAAGNCWDNVLCEFKTGVDSTNDTMWHLQNVISKTTDEYFESIKKSSSKFDLVYIDAYHEKYQVYRDFCNSLNHLNDGGIVVFHDIYPLKKEDTNIHTANGNVYEFWIELVNDYNDHTYVIEGEPGHHEGTVGIYVNPHKNFNKDLILEINHSYEYFSENIDKYIFGKIVNETEIIEKIKKANQK